MFAYIDETGNTGKNLFDSEQPTFTYGVLITRIDFDAAYSDLMSGLAQYVGQDSLHASELGIKRLEPIAQKLLKILVDSDAYTSFSRVIKSGLAIMKLVDVVFDSGENLAVPWHVYNVRPLRSFIVLKVAYILNEDLLMRFWEALMEPNKEKASKKMNLVLTGILPRISILPDARSREIIGQAVEWAIENPEAIMFYSTSKALRNGHLPNMAAFPELLGSIETKSQLWDKPVVEIKHDRQTQFGNMLKEWHAMFSTATADPLYLPFGEKHVFRRVFGSKFTVCSSKDSCGIQLVDTILWLIKRVEAGDRLPDNCAKLLSHCASNGYVYELSLQIIEQSLREDSILTQSPSLSESQIEKAEELLRIAEERRQKNMSDYARKKLTGDVN